eukprot:747574-Hanusia_phi.AAC.12
MAAVPGRTPTPTPGTARPEPLRLWATQPGSRPGQCRSADWCRRPGHDPTAGRGAAGPRLPTLGSDRTVIAG